MDRCKARWLRRLGAFLLLFAALPVRADGDAEAYRAALSEAAKLVREQRTERAIESLNALIRSHPQRPEAFNNLAVIYARQGQLERARELLTRALSTHPSYAISHRNLNEVLGEMAARAYDQALKARSTERPVPQLALIEQAPTIAQPAAVPTTVQASAAASAPTRPPRESAPETDTSTSESATISTAAGTTSAAARTPQAGPTAARTEAVLSTVQAWAEAWSAQDVKSYLTHYDSRFKPARGLSRGQWERQRKQRLERPTFIRVEVVSPKVRFADDELAVVRFEQRYRSSTMRSDVVKVLRLRRRGDHWRIVEERV